MLNTLPTLAIFQLYRGVHCDVSYNPILQTCILFYNISLLTLDIKLSRMAGFGVSLNGLIPPHLCGFSKLEHGCSKV